MTRRTLIGLASSVFLAAAASAQQHPNVERGFQADKVYQLNGIDNVNVYNGNLALALPIGMEYSGNGILKYRLTLTYNSKNWDQEEQDYAYDPVCYQPPGSVIDPPPECGQPYVKTVPSKSSNAGMGWMLSLGRLLSPSDPELYPGPVGTSPPYWYYEGPDGARHAFWGDASNGAFAYTRDGSFLRGKVIDADHFEVHFPDGLIHSFESRPDHTNRITQIKDPFGNHLDVCYAAASPCSNGGSDGDWALREYSATGTLIRQHFVRFTTLTGTSAPLHAPTNYNSVVSSVDLAVFNGLRAVYGFQYTTDTIAYQTSGCRGTYRLGETPDPKVPRLRQVTLPDPESSHWTMDYGASGVCQAISKLVFPTGGRIEWEYTNAAGSYALPTDGCRVALYPDGGIAADFYSITEGVTKKKLFYPDDQGHDVEADWTYSQFPSEQATFPCDHGNRQMEQQSTTVVTAPGVLHTASGDIPVGHSSKTEHYFSVWNIAQDVGTSRYFDVSEYGLPYTRASGSGCNHAFDANEWCLSSRQFDCSNGSCSSSPARSTYVRYEGETRQAVTPGDFEVFGYRREVATKTIFHDDDDRYVQTERKRFDGLGHFRRIITSDSWSGLSREEVTNHNPGKSDVTVDAATWTNTPADNRPGTTSPWLLNLFDSSTTSASGTSFETDFCFDSTNGFLNWKRNVKAGSPADPTKDVLVVYDHADGNGNVTRERFYGGDKTPLASGSVACNNSYSGTAAFAINHTYESGTRKTSQYDGFNFKSLDLTVDANTGLPSESADVSGLKTKFEYDALGRIAKLSPPGASANPTTQAWTTYTYGMTETPPHAVAKQWSTATWSSGTPLTEKHYYYDGLGRLKQSRTRMPSNWSATTTVYDALSRTTSSSMPQYRSGAAYESSFSPSNTSTTTYDMFDRPLVITAPDGKQTTLSYAGTRLVAKAQTFNSSDTSVSTVEAYDGIGNLLSVTENNCTTSCDPATTNIITNYGYDAARHLACVAMSGVTCGTGSHDRSFGYDGRGYLRSETHPENGTTSYEYNALGQMTKKTVTGGAAFDLLYGYDGAGRLTSVDQNSPAQNLKTFAYNDDATASAIRGKLATSIRKNYGAPSGSTATVTETFTYGENGDAAGRLTTKKTKLSGIGAQDREISQSYAYDDLDQLNDITYPNTRDYGAPTWTHLNPSYTNGFLTRVVPANIDSNGHPVPGTGFISSDIGYAPHGMVTSVTHNNGVTDTYTADSHGIARPSSIGFTPWTGGCTAPTAGSISSSAGTSLSYNQQTNLFISADGHGETPSFQWYDGTTAVGPNSSSYSVIASHSTTYRVHVATTCGYIDATIAITVQLNPPPGLTARRDPSALQINLSWQVSPGATGYDIWRQSAGAWAKLNASPWPGTSYSDGTISTDTAYVYHVFALGSNVGSSSASNNDVANSYVFGSVNAGQYIAYSDFDAILQHGINNILRATAQSTRTWHDIDNVSGADCVVSAPSDPAPPNPPNYSTVLAAHILALRCAMNRALATASVPVCRLGRNVTDQPPCYAHGRRSRHVQIEASPSSVHHRAEGRCSSAQHDREGAGIGSVQRAEYSTKSLLHVAAAGV